MCPAGAAPEPSHRQTASHVTATETLQAFARGQHLTLNVVVQAAWALVLGRYSNSDDVVFGVTVAGRPPELAGVETMLGLFINTVPQRVRLPAAASVTDWLQGLQAQQVALRALRAQPAGPRAALERGAARHAALRYALRLRELPERPERHPRRRGGLRIEARRARSSA